MKRLLALFLVAASLDRASAALPFFDAFTDRTANGGTSYTVGSPLAGQADGTGNIWNSIGGNFPGTEPLIVAGNLTYPGLSPSTGNSVSFAPASSMGDRLNFNATITTGGRAYYSFLLKVTDISSVPTTAANNFFAGFSDGSAGQVQQLARAGTRILTKKVGAGYVLGVGRNSVTTDFVYDTTVFNVNDVVFVVGSYELIGGATNVNFWINPSSSSFGATNPPTPTLSASTYSSTTGALNNSGVLGFILVCQNTNAPSGIVDDVRIGTNWIAVTGGDPAISQNPSNQTQPEGATVSFSVQARGTGPLVYKWVKDGANFLTDNGHISGSATTNLIINNISAADVGAYSVYVTNSVGNFVQSTAATLAISDPAITSEPQSRTNNFGTTATFQVSVSGTASFFYQWQKDGSNLSDGGNISGAHSATLTLTNLSFPDGGNYSVIVTNTHGVASSQAAVLTVRDPFISSQPASTVATNGANVSFTVTAQGTGPFNYQWRKNGNLIFDLDRYSGTSTATMTIANVSATDEGAYSVVVIGTYSSITSSDASLTINSPAFIYAQPTPRSVLAGSKTVMAVGVSGTAPFFYQWLRNGALIPGSSLPAYVITNVQAGDVANYSVIVSNSLNVTTSSVAALTITADLHIASTNISVLRVGDGAQTLSANGNSIFMDQFTTNGSYLGTLGLPDTGTNALITQGPNTITTPSSATGLSLSRSLDGRFLVVAGYKTSVGFGSSLNAATSSTVPRGIGLVNSAGQYNLAYASTDSSFSGGLWRSAVTDGTSNFWGAGRSPGIYYFGLSSAANLIQTNFVNIRSMALFNGSIYCVSAVSGNNGVMKLNGLPTAATNASPVVLFPTSTGSSDLEVGPSGNIIYVADDRTGINGGGVQHWEFDGTTWNLLYTLTDGLSAGARYVTADFSGSNPVVYVVSKESTDDNNRIVVFQDTGSSSTGTTVAYAGANQNFRGLRLGPTTATVAPTSLSVSRSGDNVILSWQGAFTLQSSTNVTGPYNDVVGATNPQTNSIGANLQQFFRLKN